MSSDVITSSGLAVEKGSSLMGDARSPACCNRWLLVVRGT